MTTRAQAVRPVKTWDLPLRIFHWALVVCVAAAILSAELGDEISGAMDWHPRFGLAALTLLLFRLIWGFVGGTHARFANFVRGPSAILAYLRNAASQRGVGSIGHNPLGALSVLALIATTLFQAVSGLFISDEIMVEGPLFKHVSSTLADALGELHEGNANLIIALVALHLAAILFYRVAKHEDLVKPMITGIKELPADAIVEHSRGGSAALGAVVLALAIGIVWYIATQI